MENKNINPDIQRAMIHKHSDKVTDVKDGNVTSYFNRRGSLFIKKEILKVFSSVSTF
jgi:hypothetical protein